MRIRIELDDVICVGGVAIAAVVKRWVHHFDGFHAPSICGAKRPVAVLIRRHEGTRAFEIDGLRIDLDEFEQRFPGQRASFERAANTGGRPPRSRGASIRDVVHRFARLPKPGAVRATSTIAVHVSKTGVRFGLIRHRSSAPITDFHSVSEPYPLYPHKQQLALPATSGI